MTQQTMFQAASSAVVRTFNVAERGLGIVEKTFVAADHVANRAVLEAEAFELRGKMRLNQGIADMNAHLLLLEQPKPTPRKKARKA